MVMLKKVEQAQQTWGGNNEVIDQWLESRQELLIEYCKIAGLPPFAAAKGQLPSAKDIQLFCQSLVDYISAGHFKIYDMVMSHWDTIGFTPTQDISKIYADITLITDPLLNFNDRYVAASQDNLENFDIEISHIGQLLEERFSLEDSLLGLIAPSLPKNK
ncbi:sigma D regulator [Vibrio sp. SS-MA-C1-2]|uniref:sigma D regulator n=1 Tax=Vibrio sp. SS-MA-C1-2 TaxID=2908646 RepID=UPI001F240D14|nr:sigma D regulator [Vibrio sp. SS-MA-C1-2]UJF19180.1 sigma D regulator [Vibrio sp. SS-MA-C1-2]